MGGRSFKAAKEREAVSDDYFVGSLSACRIARSIMSCISHKGKNLKDKVVTYKFTKHLCVNLNIK